MSEIREKSYIFPYVGVVVGAATSVVFNQIANIPLVELRGTSSIGTYVGVATVMIFYKLLNFREAQKLLHQDNEQKLLNGQRNLTFFFSTTARELPMFALGLIFPPLGHGVAAGTLATTLANKERVVKS